LYPIGQCFKTTAIDHSAVEIRPEFRESSPARARLWRMCHRLSSYTSHPSSFHAEVLSDAGALGKHVVIAAPFCPADEDREL
jgi:hypothetical protein